MAIFQVNLGQPVLLKLRMMEAAVTMGAVSCAKLQSNSHHLQTITKLYTDRMPFPSPIQQCQRGEFMQRPINR